MTRICLLVLVGIPASGKTTFSKLLLQTNSKHFNVMHLCFDDMFYTSNTNVENKSHKQQRQNYLKFLESLIISLKARKEIPNHHPKLSYCQNNLQNDWLIMCDDNHYYQSMRYKIYQLARRHLINFAQIYFQCLLSLALTRNKNRNEEQRVPNHIIEHMNATIEVPEPMLRSWEQNTLILKTNLNVEDVVQPQSFVSQFLEASFEKHLLPPLNDSHDENVKMISQQSLVHQLDLLLRKKIKNRMDENDCSTPAEKYQKATLLNRKRQSLLTDFAKLFASNPQIAVTQSNLQRYIESL